MIKRMLGGGRVNKMWAAALAPAVIKAAAIGLGVELAPEIEIALVSIVTGGIVWRVPNRP